LLDEDIGANPLSQYKSDLVDELFQYRLSNLWLKLIAASLEFEEFAPLSIVA